ncbi:MAG: wax ester/triacylglycerol synthase family O-acyltransferase [Betaproteobacteria bacterium]|nr:MAG: wax ester/triacylglycerol synthase family O-acyltransferase [Betaproteobacteria bacterium]
MPPKVIDVRRYYWTTRCPLQAGDYQGGRTVAKIKMSSVDTAWLRMDSTTNLMMIVGVMVFDTPLDVARFKALLEGRLLPYARFKQYVVDDGMAAHWVDDEKFDLDAHLHRVRLPGAGGERELQAMVADLASERLDKGKPLWQMHLVENYQGGSALISRIHHCIADGIALIGVLLNMTDEDPNAADTPRDIPRPKIKKFAAANNAGGGLEAVLQALGPIGAQIQAGLGPAAGALAPVAGMAQQVFDKLGPLKAPIESAMDEGMRMGTKVVAKYSRWVDDPTQAVDTAKIAAGFAQELAYLATMPTDTATRLKGKTGTVKCVAWSEPLDLVRVKDVGYVLGCSVNDVLLASVAGAIRSYIISKGDSVESGALLRAFVPVNLRPKGKEYKLGNQFGLVGLELPIGEANPIARVFEVRKRMNALKTGYQAVVSMALLGVLGYVPKAVQRQALGLLSDKGTAVMTNVPGPANPLYLAGSKIVQNMFWVPQSGNVGIGVSILSYAGGVQFGLITDRKLCPDPENIISNFSVEFDKLMTSLMWLENGFVGADASAFDNMLTTGAEAMAEATIEAVAAPVRAVKKAIASKRKSAKS